MPDVDHKIFLIGLMGSGKSYWGRHLAMHFRYPFLDLDKGIEIAEQRSVSEIFEADGEDYFREKEGQILRQLNLDYPKFIMSCGGGTACFFDNMNWMLSTGTVIWLHPPMEILAQRLIMGREKRPLIKNASSEAQIIDVLSGLMKNRLEFYEKSHIIIDEAYPTLETFEKILTHA